MSADGGARYEALLSRKRESLSQNFQFPIMIVGGRGTKTLEPIEGCGTRWKQELDPRGICNVLAQSKENDPLSSSLLRGLFLKRSNHIPLYVGIIATV